MSKKGHFMPCNDCARWERVRGFPPYKAGMGGGGDERFGGEGKCLNAFGVFLSGHT